MSTFKLLSIAFIMAAAGTMIAKRKKNHLHTPAENEFDHNPGRATNQSDEGADATKIHTH